MINLVLSLELILETDSFDFGFISLTFPNGISSSDGVIAVD